MKIWKCKKCSEEWLSGDGVKGPPRKCYNMKPYPQDLEFCGGTEFELISDNPDLPDYKWIDGKKNEIPSRR